MSGTDFYYEPQVRLAEELAVDRADRGRRPDVLRQFGHRGDRSGDQARALSHEAAGHHRVPRRVPRPLAGLAVAHRQQGDPAARLRPVHAGRLPRAVSRYRTASASADAAAAQCLVVHRRSALHAPRLARRSLGHCRRADPGRGRLPRRAAGVPPGAARADDEARHPAGRRRSAVGHGPHGKDVRVGSHRPQGATSSPSPRGLRRACRSASPAPAPR